MLEGIVVKGSRLPADHATGNQGGCWCAGNRAYQIFDEVGYARYRVRQYHLREGVRAEALQPAAANAEAPQNRVANDLAVPLLQNQIEAASRLHQRLE